MEILNNKTLRVEDSDFVTTEIFNDVFSSLDRTIFTTQEVQVNSLNQVVGAFTSTLTNNISISISIRVPQETFVDIKINYTDSIGSRQYEVIDSFILSGPETYSFNPAFISVLEGTQISIVASASSLNPPQSASIYLSASAIAM